ncbi:hypothetical protein [Glaciimonas sp. PCH181]|uniref:hypothetical protein n=1 Tax=Glaciimonas sp. PCH181 TaxID=2133943 RepID=UPI000D3A88E7|nr:hypothetical protein [Glaciimonas sp. PCH181]PUA17188.1 hypothetical protein C7W93_14700 [Glaciimonas sp. PCH181]
MWRKKNQTEMKKLASRCPENGIKTIHWIDLVFNVLVQTKTKQLIAYLDKLCLVFGANNAVKRGILIQDADQYRLSSDDTAFDNFGFKGRQNLSIQSSDYFVEIDGEACFQEIPLVGLHGASRPDTVRHAQKYRSMSPANKHMGRDLSTQLYLAFYVPAFYVALHCGKQHNMRDSKFTRQHGGAIDVINLAVKILELPPHCRYLVEELVKQLQQDVG